MNLLFSIVNVMAVLTIKLNKYSLDTFIEVLVDELNKLEHKNNDKTSWG